MYNTILDCKCWYALYPKQANLPPRLTIYPECQKHGTQVENIIATLFPQPTMPKVQSPANPEPNPPGKL